MTRKMLIVARHVGLVEADVISGEFASVVGRHHAAILRFLEGDGEVLARFRGAVVPTLDGGYELEADPARIVELYYAGDLGYDDIYALE